MLTASGHRLIRPLNGLEWIAHARHCAETLEPASADATDPATLGALIHLAQERLGSCIHWPVLDMDGWRFSDAGISGQATVLALVALALGGCDA